MHSHDSPSLTYRTVACDLCRCAIDFESGFFFEIEDGSGNVVHPNCMSYFLTYDERPTYGVTHTCKDGRCVNPDHLELVSPPVTCDFGGESGGTIGCYAPEGLPWAFDHFHAPIDGEPCPCRHTSQREAIAAHGGEG